MDITYLQKTSRILLGRVRKTFAMHQIDNTYLTLEKLHEIIHEQQPIELSQDATKRILDCRSFLDNNQ